MHKHVHWWGTYACLRFVKQCFSMEIYITNRNRRSGTCLHYAHLLIECLFYAFCFVTMAHPVPFMWCWTAVWKPCPDLKPFSEVYWVCSCILEYIKPLQKSKLLIMILWYLSEVSRFAWPCKMDINRLLWTSKPSPWGSVSFHYFDLHCSSSWCRSQSWQSVYHRPCQFLLDQSVKILLWGEERHRENDHHDRTVWLWIPRKHQQAGYNTTDW